jgi:hypothetical protein
VIDAIDEAPPHRLGRMMGREGLEAFARNLAALHRPATFEWVKRFQLKPLAVVPALAYVEPVAAAVDGRPAPLPRRGSGHRCAQRGNPVSFAVVKFCWNSPQRFRGSIYCYDCQRTIRPHTALGGHSPAAVVNNLHEDHS